MPLSDVEKEIRKLRKKLRQIENLERLEFEGRELTEDEEAKVLKKGGTRKKLQEYLILFAKEIEEGGEISEDEDVTPVEVAPPPTVYKSYSAVAEVPASSQASHRSGSKKADEGEGWQTVGQKKVDPQRSEEPKMQTKTEIKVEPSIKVADKRPAETLTKTKKETETAKKSKKEATKAPPATISPEEKRREACRREWAGKEFTVLTLEGHNDLVSSVYLDRDCLLSGSRDTTIKVWNIKNGFEEKSLGGHTDSVTAILLLSECASKKFAETYDLQEQDRLVLSGSQDCSLRIWSLNTGQMLKSVYTYNPVTALTYIDTPGLIVAGSGGGKVELWDPESGAGLQSLIAHEDAVTEVRADGSMVYSCSVDGIIKVYQLRDGQLHVVHESDDVTCLSGSPLLLRHIRSMAASRDLVYYGDDGNNVKVLDWKRGEVHKLKNHTGDFGSTDAMCCHDDVLLTSGYDLDHGVGYINMWSLPAEDYAVTLRDDSIGRIMCMSCARPSVNQLAIATGGLQLQLWLPNGHASGGEVIVRAEHLPEFSAPPDDSDLDSEGDMSDSDTENVTSYFWRSPAKRPRGADTNGEDKGWGSWCEIL